VPAWNRALCILVEVVGQASAAGGMKTSETGLTTAPATSDQPETSDSRVIGNQANENLSSQASIFRFGPFSSDIVLQSASKQSTKQSKASLALDLASMQT